MSLAKMSSNVLYWFCVIAYNFYTLGQGVNLYIAGQGSNIYTAGQGLNLSNNQRSESPEKWICRTVMMKNEFLISILCAACSMPDSCICKN